MGQVTTHVLNVATGRPGAGVRVTLLQLVEESRKLLLAIDTNANGRCDQPLLQGDELVIGEYELVFDIAEYFREEKVVLPTPPFLSTVVIRFGVADPAAHYHVPLLISPWGYSTYRGS